MIDSKLFNILPNETNSDIITINSEVLVSKNIALSVKREYLIHPYISGNKWRKLKYNIDFFKNNNFDGILTFGGVFSNHIFATAAAGKFFGFKTKGIIRGENVDNKTLHFAKNICNMDLQFVDRQVYRDLTNNYLENSTSIIDAKNYYILPEGGTNDLAIKGCSEILNAQDFSTFSHICTCVGTGGTVAGIIQASDNQANIIGFSALKGINWQSEIEHLLRNTNASHYSNWVINSDYAFGGYAKKTVELEKFIHDFEMAHSIPLEFVYTAKMFYGIFDLIQKDFFKPGSHILAIHTGGLRP